MAGQEGIERFKSYWLSLPKASDGIPAREDFHPLDMPRLVPQLVVLELLRPDEVIVRLRGEAVAIRTGSAFSMARRGRNYLDDVSPPSRDWLTDHISSIVHFPAGLEFTVQEIRPDGFTTEATGLALPFTRRRGDHLLHLVCYTYESATPFVSAPTGRTTTLDWFTRLRPVDLGVGIADLPFGDFPGAETLKSRVRSL